MPKHKLSKSDEQWLRKEAKKLPPDFSATAMRKVISGEEAGLSGYKKTSDTDEAVYREKLYVSKIPNIIPVNHTRRLIKAYEEQGWVGVNTYLDKYRVPEDKIFPVAPKQAEPVKPKTLFQKIRSKFTN